MTTLALRERWSVAVPGHSGLVTACLGSEPALYVSFGWGLSYAALGVRRLALSSGAKTAELRTRSQQASGFASAGNVVYVATDRRVFEVDATTLDVHRQWERRIRRYSMQLVPDGERLIMANWLAPSLGILSLVKGTTRRVEVGPQIQLLSTNRGVLVGSGQYGGFATLDAPTGRLSPCYASPRYTAATADESGRELWLARAGKLINKGGDPPALVLEATDHLVRMVDGREAGGAVLDAPCIRVWRDESRRLLWCATTRPIGAQLRTGLEAVDLHSGEHRGAFLPEPQEHVLVVCPEHGVVVSTRRPNYTNATCLLTCYELPQAGFGAN